MAPLISFKSGGNGLAIGKTATNNFLDIAMQTNITGTTTISGNTTITGKFIHNVVGDEQVVLNSDAVNSWSKALYIDYEVIYNSSTWTIFRQGRVIMVQCHGWNGSSATSNVDSTNMTGILQDYKPSYNVSAIVGNTSNSTVARMWIDATTGNVAMAAIGSAVTATWYGTLIYII